MNQNRLVVCDVCDTLYRSNTTFDFIRFFLQKKRGYRLFLFQLLSSRKSPVFYGLLVAGRIVRKDLVRLLALRLLTGETEEELRKTAGAFYEEVLLNKRNDEIFSVIERYRPSRILLVSASIDPVVKVIAERNDFEYLSSRFRWITGRFAGQLEADLTGNKHKWVKEELAASAVTRLIVITDNRSDWELVGMAQERFVVVAQAHEKRFWEKLSPQFLLVPPQV